jgi:hypothetical protein
VVLELPSTSIPPAELSWLPRLRSTDEVQADLVASFEAAVEPVGRLIVLVSKSLDVLADEEGTEAGWVIHEVAARAANDELRITARSVSVASVGEGDAHYPERAHLYLSRAAAWVMSPDAGGEYNTPADAARIIEAMPRRTGAPAQRLSPDGHPVQPAGAWFGNNVSRDGDAAPESLGREADCDCFAATSGGWCR